MIAFALLVGASLLLKDFERIKCSPDWFRQQCPAHAVFLPADDQVLNILHDIDINQVELRFDLGREGTTDYTTRMSEIAATKGYNIKRVTPSELVITKNGERLTFHDSGAGQIRVVLE